MKYLILLLILTGCGIQGNVIIPVITEEVFDYSVYFCPSDDCTAALAEVISSVDCAFFDFDIELLISDFNGRLIVDSDNYEYVEHLENVKQDHRSAFMHNKFCVGKDIVVTGSMNPTVNGVSKNNNNLVIIKSAGLASIYRQEFEEMWNGDFGKGKSTINTLHLGNSSVSVYFCPEDQCAEKVKDRILDAQSSIYFMTFSFTHEGIANSILLRMEDGVSVKGIFENRGAGSKYSKFNVLDYQGADVIKDKNPYTMHHKVFVIDNSTVITGSFNPSKNADSRNDENILIVKNKEFASLYLKEFERLWNE